MERLSTKPYMLRALYEWCSDSGLTPYIEVWVNQYTQVPRQFVHEDKIVLSISALATKDLTIDNEWIHFHARFGGASQELWIPVGHVTGIFAKETGEGMGFEVEPYEPEADVVQAEVEPVGEANTGGEPTKKVLKFVK